MDPVVNPAVAAAAETKLPHEVMGAVVKFIRERRYEPGERLPSERELAERFGVSRNTIREVLSTLEWFRVVERRPQSGVYLRQESSDPSLEALVMASGFGIELDEREVLQSMETRYLLEMQATRLCCERRTDADLARLRDILDRTADCIRAGGNIAELDSAFHLAIVTGTGNDVLVRVVKPFYLLSGKRRTVYFSDLRRSRRSLADHRKLYEAILARDGDAAQAVLQSHLGTVERHWRSALSPAGTARSPDSR